MSHEYLSRDDAPFGGDVWNALDRIMAERAKSILTGRRMMHVSGPHGLGLTSLSLGDTEIEPGLIVSDTIPLVHIYKSFSIGKRDLALYEKERILPPVRELVQAVDACAGAEDELLFHGRKGAPGLLSAQGIQKSSLSSWDKVGAAIDDVITAVTLLDDAGYHGPYALALSPTRYNLLFRMYERGNTTEIGHVQTLATDGVFKAPVLKKGGVLMNTGRSVASILLGQDMSLGFHGPEGDRIELAVSESIALALRQPGAVCALTE